MRHSTIAPALEPARKPRGRVLAATIATALAAGGLSFAAAAPANAAVTDTVTGYSLTWGFQTGANSWKIIADNADLVEPSTVSTSITQAPLATPFTASKGFTLRDGQGTIDPTTKVGSIEFDSTITYYPQANYGTLVPNQPWIELSDFELISSSSMRGVLTAVVDYHKSNDEDLAVPTRVQIANFDISTFSVSGANVALTSAVPDWAGAVPVGTYAAGYSDSWPTQLVDLVKTPTSPQGDFNVYFYRTGATAGNTAKAPVPLSVVSEVVVPSVSAAVVSQSPKNGAAVSVAGDGFRGITNPGDAGVYVGVAESGGLPDVSKIANIALFAAAAYVPTAALSTGTFSTSLTVPAAKIDPTKSYSVYTWQAHAHSNTSQDTETVLAFDADALAWKASTASIAVSAGAVTAGESVTATSTVPSDATGAVEFFDNGSSIGSATVASGSASVNTPALAAGSHDITATYSGDDFYPAVSAAAATVVANASAVTDPVVTNPVVTVPVATAPVVNAPVVTAPVATTPTFVVKVAPKVTLKAATFTKATKPKVSVTLPKLPNGTYATGNVRIYVNGKSVKVIKLKASAKGKVEVTLPKKYSRSIKVKVKFGGNDVAKAVTSQTVKYTVKKTR